MSHINEISQTRVKQLLARGTSVSQVLLILSISARLERGASVKFHPRRHISNDPTPMDIFIYLIILPRLHI